MNLAKEELNKMKDKDVFEFYKRVLKKNKNCIISTASLKGKTESAVMNYAETKDGKLYIYCLNDMRKYPNLIENPRISIIIYNDPDYIQMDGSIKFLGGDEAKKAKEELIKKRDNKVNYHTDSRCVYFLFTPTWTKIKVDAKFPAKYVIIKE